MYFKYSTWRYIIRRNINFLHLRLRRNWDNSLFGLSVLNITGIIKACSHGIYFCEINLRIPTNTLHM